jgi:uncharacterized membrane protein YccC
MESAPSNSVLCILNNTNLIWFLTNFLPETHSLQTTYRGAHGTFVAPKTEKTSRRETYVGAKHSSRMKTIVMVVSGLLAVLLASLWVSFSDPNAPADRNVPGATTGPGRDSLKPSE